MCGIAAAYLFDRDVDVAPLLFEMLLSQTNRMGYSAGIAVLDPERQNDRLISADWGLGPIDTAFGLDGERDARLAKLEGGAGIAHGRYATSNANRAFSERQRLAMAQPYTNADDVIARNFAIGYNGNAANGDDLLVQLRGQPQGYHIRTETDTEAMRIGIKIGIARRLQETGNRKLTAEDYQKILADFASTWIGAYSLTLIDGTGNLLLARDPQGTRPLVYVITDEGLLAASEPTAFYDQNIFIGIENVPPGHFLLMNGSRSLEGPFKFAEPARRQCAFDPLYFSHVTSSYDGIMTQAFRRGLGAALAQQDIDDGIKFTLDDFVACVPETARAMTNGYLRGCLEAGIVPPSPIEALVRHKHYRSFMSDLAAGRIEKTRRKFRETWGLLKGKRLFLVDDSQVRGDVMRALIPIIREVVQPEEIHLRFAWDMFRNPCYRGIDVPKAEDLIAHVMGGDQERIRQHLDVDSLKYLPIGRTREILAGNSDLSIDELCTACVDGNYPTDFERRLAGISEAA